jgi:hypothetical protein
MRLSDFLPYAILALIVAAWLWRWRRGRAAARAVSGQSFEQRYPGLPQEALDRRARSMARLSAEGVPLNPWLPVIETEAGLRLPPTEQVAMRAVAALVVALKSEGLEQGHVDDLVEDWQLQLWLSPDEAAFIANPSPDAREREILTWRYEAANALLWALGFVERLDGPRETCDPAELTRLLKENARQQFLTQARLRPAGEILDQADLIFRYRWALVDARINGRPAPAGLSGDVAMERHHAFNWLIYHDEQPWDEVSLDT